MKQALLALTALLLISSLSCDKKDSGPEKSPPKEIRPEATDTSGTNKSLGIDVLDEAGQVIPSVRVLVGASSTANNPWLVPDATGHLDLPANWTNLADLTVEAPGFIRLTLKDQTPGPLNLKLKKKSQLPQFSLKGTATGVNTKDKDGFVDFAIMLDSLNKSDVLNFNISKVISPWTEIVSVFGFEFPIPQNIFLPKQKESYFFTITLQKPWFNLFYDTYGTKSLYALRGKFPLRKVLGELQNKVPYVELINDFDMSSAGRVDYGFTSTTNTPVVDSTQISLDQNYTIKAPQVDATQVVIGISSFKEKNFYQPMDVKYMQSQESVVFKSIKTATPYFIGVLKNKDELMGDNALVERMSISIDTPRTTANYLPLTKDPTWASANELQVDLPSMVDSGFTEQGLVVVVSELQNLTLPDGRVLKYKIPIWEVHSARWSSTVQLPELDSASTTPKRVEVTLLAREVDNSGQQNPVTIVSSHEERVETATHLTKSARDY